MPRVPAPEIEAAVLKALEDKDVSSARDPNGGLGLSLAELIEGTVERVVVGAGSLEILRCPEGDRPNPIVVPWAPAPSTRRRAVIGAADDGVVRPIRAETRARLVEGIARARCWLDDLVAGRVKDTRELARLAGRSERSVRMALNLAFLAPEIVRAAVEGTLPDEVGISRLVEAPVAWREQRRIVSPPGLDIDDPLPAMTPPHKSTVTSNPSPSATLAIMYLTGLQVLGSALGQPTTQPLAVCRALRRDLG